MLTTGQAEFLDCYFQRLNRLDAASALGVGMGEAETIAQSSPVAEIIASVVPMIMEDVAAHGRRIYDLPKQADQQVSSVIEVHFNVG
jgi:hypothetical protein